MNSNVVHQPIRRAATIVVLRDGAQGIEALMLRRVERANDRSSGAYVFPGGTLDAADAACAHVCAGLGEADACARLGLEGGGLDYYIAAIRECFEEAGLLYAYDASSRFAALDGVLLPELRAQLRRGEIGLGALCERLSLRLATDRLAYHSHWLTPPGLPKRFDTRFFIAELPPGQEAALHSEETLEHRWFAPAHALARADELALPNPTRHTLAAIAGFRSVAECLASVQAQGGVRRIMPLLADGPRGRRPVHPDEPSYPEISRIDPHGAGKAGARYVIQPGLPVRLSERVVRVTAPNPSVMTGPGTNTYLVGHPNAEGWAVIDPGPADASHVQAILDAAPGPIRWILTTHTHRDHSPAAALLRARTGATVLGMRARHASGQDTDFAPEREPVHGERIALAPGATLRVLHTPGHASNHLCYLLEQEQTLFTGDHVMQGSTVVIHPPDGDMGAYLASLQALLDEDLAWLAPGHGFLIPEPRRAIERLLRHRRAREAKVVNALRELGPSAIERLVVHVYDDVPSGMHPVAQRSLEAHLLLLEAQGRVARREAAWSLR